MDVKEFARLGGKARAKALGKEGLKAHAAKMVAARKYHTQRIENITGQPAQQPEVEPQRQLIEKTEA